MTRGRLLKLVLLIGGGVMACDYSSHYSNKESIKNLENFLTNYVIYPISLTPKELYEVNERRIRGEK